MRLHLAASRFERLPKNITEVMCQPSWIHLGEEKINWQLEIQQKLQYTQYSEAARLAGAWLYRSLRPRYSRPVLDKLYASTDFRTWHFAPGDRLDFPDNSFSFICSEHFFEHLFLDEAAALLDECYRILQPGGIIRTAVPDADLRTYMKIEPAGFPSNKVPWANHQKHKTRWSVYSLSQALSESSLKPVPVMYCSKAGDFITRLPNSDSFEYKSCIDKDITKSIGYFRRLPSLIVDGIKE